MAGKPKKDLITIYRTMLMSFVWNFKRILYFCTVILKLDVMTDIETRGYEKSKQ